MKRPAQLCTNLSCKDYRFSKIGNIEDGIRSQTDGGERISATLRNSVVLHQTKRKKMAEDLRIASPTAFALTRAFIESNEI